MMKALRIEPADNVAVVAQDTRKGDVLRHAGGEVTALEDIGLGTRSPSKPLRRGNSSASTASPSAGPPRPLPPGAFVHTHNLEDITEELCRQYVAAFRDGRGA